MTLLNLSAPADIIFDLHSAGIETAPHVYCQVNDKEKVRSLFLNYKPKIVINLAAQAGVRYSLENPEAYIILDERISKEPLGPLVRHGDHQWGDVVRWSLNAMIIAEELGVTSENVDAQMSSNVPEVLRLLGVEGNYGEMLELSNDWAYQIIKQIGNYSESYEANVGPDTPLEIARGLNALWTQGGILYAPPFR